MSMNVTSLSPISQPSSSTVASISVLNTTAFSSTTTIVAVPTTNDVPIALIGGIVGGIVALLLIVGLIACISARNRQGRQRSLAPAGSHSSANDVSMVSARDFSNYGKIDATQLATTDYDTFIFSTAQQDYDVGDVPQQ
jgi:hypothetical protein